MMPDLTLEEALVFEAAMSFLVDFSCLARKTRRVSTALWSRSIKALKALGAKSWDFFPSHDQTWVIPNLTVLSSELSLDELQILNTAATHAVGTELCDEPGLEVFRKLAALTTVPLQVAGIVLEDDGYDLWKDDPESWIVITPQPLPLPPPPIELTIKEKIQRQMDLAQLERLNRNLTAGPKMRRELILPDGTKIKF